MIELMRMTLRDPLSGWRRLQGLPWGPGDRWALIFATSACSAILSWLSGLLLPAPSDAAGLLAMLTGSQISMASIQVASAGFGAYMLAEVGRIFGGTGRFADALLAIGWIEAVMVALQSLQLVLTVVLPPLGALVGIATLLLAAYLMVALTMAVHGFRNALLVVLGILGTIMLTSFLLSILAATLGFLPGAPA